MFERSGCARPEPVLLAGGLLGRVALRPPRAIGPPPQDTLREPSGPQWEQWQPCPGGCRAFQSPRPVRTSAKRKLARKHAPSSAQRLPAHRHDLAPPSLMKRKIAKPPNCDRTQAEVSAWPNCWPTTVGNKQAEHTFGCCMGCDGKVRTLSVTGLQEKNGPLFRSSPPQVWPMSPHMSRWTWAQRPRMKNKVP